MDRVALHPSGEGPQSCRAVIEMQHWSHPDDIDVTRPRRRSVSDAHVVGGPTTGAERVGFEPTDHLAMVNALAGRPVRPLRHLSRDGRSVAAGGIDAPEWQSGDR